MDFGEEPVGGSDRQKRKSRYHRHTPRQIQQLESYIYLYIYILSLLHFNFVLCFIFSSRKLVLFGFVFLSFFWFYPCFDDLFLNKKFCFSFIGCLRNVRIQTRNRGCS
jgi:hypothetical protein